MDVVYKNKKVEDICTNLQAATKFFGGQKPLAVSLLGRINALCQAETIKDIIVQPQFRFHALHNKKNQQLEGYFAIDVKTKTQPWRIIIRPLNENKEPYVPCNIDDISESVMIVEVREVSKHYE